MKRNVQLCICTAIILRCINTLEIERHLTGDHIKVFDECRNVKNIENIENIEKGCKCGSGYETAILESNQVKCLNRSDILSTFNSSHCTMIGYQTKQTRIVTVRKEDSVFYLEKDQSFANCIKKTNGHGIDVIYPMRKLNLSFFWNFSPRNPSYFQLKKFNITEYSGVIIRINNLCQNKCIVAKVGGTLRMNIPTTTTGGALTTTAALTMTTPTSTIATSNNVQHNSSVNIVLLVSIISVGLLVILVSCVVMVLLRRYRRNAKKSSSNISQVANPEYEYVSANPNLARHSQRMNQRNLAPQINAYEIPIDGFDGFTANEPVYFVTEAVTEPVYSGTIPVYRPGHVRNETEPVYFETELDYDVAVSAHDKTDKIPVYAQVNKNR